MLRPEHSTSRSISECVAKAVSMWSKNPTPVEIWARPEMKSGRTTLSALETTAQACASSVAIRCMLPHSSVPRSLWWSQSPWSTVKTSAPTSPRMVRATPASAAPKSPRG